MKEDSVADLLHKAVGFSKAAKRIKGRLIDRIQKPSNANSRWPRQDTLPHSGTEHVRTQLCASVSDADYIQRIVGWQVNHELERT
jgi:hypothetical protein